MIINCLSITPQAAGSEPAQQKKKTNTYIEKIFHNIIVYVDNNKNAANTNKAQ